ncbi:hypothetical protein ACSBR1_017821 [Camellia fascicularis]
MPLMITGSIEQQVHLLRPTLLSSNKKNLQSSRLALISLCSLAPSRHSPPRSGNITGVGSVQTISSSSAGEFLTSPPSTSRYSSPMLSSPVFSSTLFCFPRIQLLLLDVYVQIRTLSPLSEWFLFTYVDWNQVPEDILESIWADIKAIAIHNARSHSFHYINYTTRRTSFNQLRRKVYIVEIFLNSLGLQILFIIKMDVDEDVHVVDQIIICSSSASFELSN